MCWPMLQRCYAWTSFRAPVPGTANHQNCPLYGSCLPFYLTYASQTYAMHRVC